MDENKDVTEAAAVSLPTVEDITDVREISAEERAAIKRQTAWALPNSPAGRGMTAADVKPYFYEGLVGDKGSLADYVNRLAVEVNRNLTTIRALLQQAGEHTEDKNAHKDVLDERLGDIEEALDGIIAIQEALIGGEGV